ncbi:ABC transporter permease subunit [Actinomadura chokoriensis]|uniref:ABC transporter permease subunit n=1 Tax=Actinomadura chokoriensis TaxID=454156 RepID=UPI0031F8D0C6
MTDTSNADCPADSGQRETSGGYAALGGSDGRSENRMAGVGDTVAAEWCKLRSVRSTGAVLGTVGGFMVLCALWSWYVARYWDGLPAARRGTAQTAPAEQPLAVSLPVCAVVLGALTLTSEYSSGMIRATLAAMPRRRALFLAKGGVAAGVMGAAALAAPAAGSVAGAVIIGDRPVAAFQAPAADVAVHLLWLGLTTAAITLVAFGLGGVLRSTAATITSGMAVLFVLPALARLLPSPWDERIWSALPGSLANQIAGPPGSSGDHGALSPPAAVALLAAYTVIALGAGAYAFTRRDA